MINWLMYNASLVELYLLIEMYRANALDNP
jgi:hypothetical protein